MDTDGHGFLQKITKKTQSPEKSSSSFCQPPVHFSANHLSATKIRFLSVADVLAPLLYLFATTFPSFFIFLPMIFLPIVQKQKSTRKSVDWVGPAVVVRLRGTRFAG